MKRCPAILVPLLSALTALAILATPLAAQVPQRLNYQGRVAVGTVNFDGTGQFRFALVNATGSTTFWSNDGTSTAGSQPAASVPLTVTKGLYSLALGDTALPNMTAIPASVFENADVRLRVWFDDGVNGSQLLTPDQRLSSVGFAMKAESANSATTVPDGAITAAKLATSAVGATAIAAGSVDSARILDGTIVNADIAAAAGIADTKLATISSAGKVANSATTASASNVANTIVLRNATGGFNAGTITAALNGNATTATTAGSATNFTGSLSGDVTGTQSATAIAATTVTGKTLAGFASAPGAVGDGDTILGALGKLDGNVALRAPLNSPVFS